MRKILLSLFLVPFLTVAQQLHCGDIFTDTGGANGNYGNNQNYSVTIYPDSPDGLVTLTFTQFALENGYDFMRFYDGNATDAPPIPGNVLIGGGFFGYTGTNSPGVIQSNAPDGSLTIQFTSDFGISAAGWVADISCVSRGNCGLPANFALSDAQQTSVTFSWTDTQASQWEIYIVPENDPGPGPDTAGTTVATPSAVIEGLSPLTRYDAYLRGVCSDGTKTAWLRKLPFATKVSNDECAQAIEIPVNLGTGCQQTATGYFYDATPSSLPAGTCQETPVNDVWFYFTAPETDLEITAQGSSLGLTLYGGSCGNLTSMACSFGHLSGLVPGQVYYVRVFRTSSSPTTYNSFEICLRHIATCASAAKICGIHDYENVTGVPNQGQIGCLFTSPNPAFFIMKVENGGSMHLTIAQTSTGTEVPTPLDVDYALWGPFANHDDACAAFSDDAQPLSCSYSSAAVENLQVENAQSGEYYLLLVTNFSNQPGHINISLDADSTGSIACTGIRLNAFLDQNGNQVKDPGEPDFYLGKFNYQAQGSGTTEYGAAPSGTYIISDIPDTQPYDISFSIDSNYGNYYSSSTVLTGITSSNANVETHYFPVQAAAPMTDLYVSISPVSQVVAGFTQISKVTFRNNGNQPINTATITFTGPPGIALSGTWGDATAIISGNQATCNATMLMPMETRSFFVESSIPPIPNVSFGQVLIQTVSGTASAPDAIPSNNNASLNLPVLSSYDPNGKWEAHGSKILYTSFTNEDFLYYTIKFENTGNSVAHTILIIDQLNALLDAGTIEMVDASHDYSLQRVDHSLYFKFSPIELPVSSPDGGGRGFVTFRVKPVPGYGVGTIIPNTATIIFDVNPALVTGTCYTEFTDDLANPAFDNGSVSLYPNPAQQTVQIDMAGSGQLPEQVFIYDMIGKNVARYDCTGSAASLDVASLSRGVYVIEIQTKEKLRIIRKLILD